MKIIRAAFDEMNRLISGKPPETGGIIGSRKGDVISEIVVDKASQSFEISCKYEPNVDFLNRCISEWANEGIIFMGVFHTHFAGVRTLSCADKQYIREIVEKMPEEITYLYFPVFVLPNRELVCYRAEKSNKEIKICYEDVIFI